MHYLGNNYTGAYQDVSMIVDKLRRHKIDSALIEKYARVMLTGGPNHFVADTMGLMPYSTGLSGIIHQSI